MSVVIPPAVFFAAGHEGSNHSSKYLGHFSFKALDLFPHTEKSRTNVLLLYFYFKHLGEKSLHIKCMRVFQCIDRRERDGLHLNISSEEVN